MGTRLVPDNAAQAFEKIEELYKSLDILKKNVPSDDYQSFDIYISERGLNFDYLDLKSNLCDGAFIQSLPEDLQETLSDLINYYQSYMEKTANDIKDNLKLENGSLQEKKIWYEIYHNCAKSLEKDVREIIDLTKSISTEVKQVLHSTRKIKTIISGKCLIFLLKAYAITPKPSKSERALIASNCGLTESQVRVWFTNRRVRHPIKLVNSPSVK